MRRIEQTYLNQLVLSAARGSSNAFAELTAAVFRRHYRYMMLMLHDEEEALARLKKVYVQVLHNIAFLDNEELYLVWSCRICYKVCQDKGAIQLKDSPVRTPAGRIPAARLYLLPIAESQIMIMRFVQRMSVKTIGSILNMEPGAVRRYMDLGIHHLENIRAVEEGASEEVEEAIPREHIKRSSRGKRKPDPVIIQEILDEVFETCHKKPNSAPMEVLYAYSTYRKERFSLQKGILIAAMILFLLLPLLFIGPSFDLNAIPRGERGLPVVTIDVKPGLPVSKVLAEVNRHSLPVYEADAFEYQVEPVRNGTLTIEVELINKQARTQELEMEYVDSDGPELTDSSITDNEVILFVRDEGIGIDYREIYAADEEGNLYYPISWEEATGMIVFEYPDSPWDVYIPDHIGNRLHLSFVFE